MQFVILIKTISLNLATVQLDTYYLLCYVAIYLLHIFNNYAAAQKQNRLTENNL
jgi:hypothetical protein